MRNAPNREWCYRPKAAVGFGSEMQRFLVRTGHSLQMRKRNIVYQGHAESFGILRLSSSTRCSFGHQNIGADAKEREC